MFDAHCHLDMMDDHAAVLGRARAAGVQDLLVSGVNPEGWREQLMLLGDGVHIALGLHPWHVSKATDAWSEQLSELVETLPVSAIGETGLDFGARMDPEGFEAQASAFENHIGLAKHHRLPLVLHVVSAHQRTLEILSRTGPLVGGGMVHAFSWSAEQALQYVRLGLHISICGTITDPRRRKLRRAVAEIPADRLLVETDSPDQTPLNRRPGPNEPAFLIDVVAAVAEARGEDPQLVAHQTTLNAKTLFQIQ